jgi:hypothetical protein
MIIETITPDETLLCRDRIEITGRLLEKRNLIMINDSPTGVTDRSLELLLRFGIALKKDGRGWVHLEDFASGTGATQFISRLRNELRSLTLAKDGKNHRERWIWKLRLSRPPQNLIIVRKASCNTECRDKRYGNSFSVSLKGAKLVDNTVINIHRKP